MQTYNKEDLFKNLKEGTVGHTVLSKPSPPDLVANFDVEQVS
ncbi:MAG: hypothetical protein ACK521_02970 [bacterium]|jgi:hypothetical protein